MNKNELKIGDSQIILYQTQDSDISIDVLVENETVWLSQVQMAQLFDTTKTNITMHIGNVFKEGELEKSSGSKKSLLPAPDGKNYMTNLYNLDVIISVGYRVKSQRGTDFRIWARNILKDYILKGYAIHERFERLENRVTSTEKKIDFFVRTSLPPKQGVFFEGQIFDAYVFAVNLVKSAKKTIVLIDNYIDESVLLLLSKRQKNVNAKIYTKQISAQLQLDLKKHNAQYNPITIDKTASSHDRFLIIEDVVYFIGASLKDLGKKLFAFGEMKTKGTELLKRM
jgi:hypothetical protein